MFEGNMIIQSAVSAFNNAALVAPAFLWWAVLALPLFVLVYFCGGAFLQRVGWNKQNIASHVAIWAIALTAVWVVLFGGNYAVLRDAETVLPFVVAAIVFVAAVFLGAYSRKVKLPQFRGASWKQKIGIAAVWMAVLAVVGLSDVHTWWGPILQIGAFVSGILIGRVTRCDKFLVMGTTLVFGGTTTAILMQPEFFRFGQLGALGPVHLGALILVAAAIAGTVALRVVRPRGIIRNSAYIKLKWLARIMSVLCVALFVLTESVVVFLGMMLMFFAWFALSVVHAKTIPADVCARVFSIMLVMFGVITVMPAVGSLGILYWISLPQTRTWEQIKFLL